MRRAPPWLELPPQHALATAKTWRCSRTSRALNLRCRWIHHLNHGESARVVAGGGMFLVSLALKRDICILKKKTMFKCSKKVDMYS
jgi:hypothetical protein